MDNLGYTLTEDGSTFNLAAGTTLGLGGVTVTLTNDVTVVSPAMPRDAVVGLIMSSGNAAVNSANFPYIEDGKQITYGGRCQRQETVIEPEPVAPAAPKAKKKK